MTRHLGRDYNTMADVVQLQNEPSGSINNAVQEVPSQTQTAEVLPSQTVLPEISSREKLVETAVKFLQNPKVQSSSLTQKKLFLKKKGLTDEEIHRAILMAGISNDVSATQIIQAPPTYIAQRSPLLTRVKDESLAIIIISGAAFGIYYLFKNYIRPLFFEDDPKNERIAKLEQNVAELQATVNQTLAQVTTSLKEIHQILSENNHKLEEVLVSAQTNSSSQKQKESQQLMELKGEITSLKGLLLNRHQFPSVLPNSSLPSWQLTNQSESITSSKEPTDSVTSSDGINGIEEEETTRTESTA